MIRQIGATAPDEQHDQLNGYNCPSCGLPVDVPASHAGGVVCCPYSTCGEDMVIPPTAQPKQQGPPTERCYDCGEAIPEGKVYRREVAVSRTYQSGGVYSTSGGRYGSGSYSGSAVTYAQVSLCRRCCEEHDDEERRKAEVAKFLFIVMGVMILVGILAFLTLIAGYKAGPVGVLGVGLVIFGIACVIPITIWLRRK